MKQSPIAQGWQRIIDQAPTDEERAKAESWHHLFYAGAQWMWTLYCSIDEDEIEEFVAALEAEFDQWHAEVRRGRNVQ